MEKVVGDFLVTRAEDESGQRIVRISMKVNPRHNFLEMVMGDDDIVIFRIFKNGLPGVGRTRVSIEALQVALEMLPK